MPGGSTWPTVTTRTIHDGRPRKQLPRSHLLVRKPRQRRRHPSRIAGVPLPRSSSSDSSRTSWWNLRSRPTTRTRTGGGSSTSPSGTDCTRTEPGSKRCGRIRASCRFSCSWNTPEYEGRQCGSLAAGRRTGSSPFAAPGSRRAEGRRKPVDDAGATSASQSDDLAGTHDRAGTSRSPGQRSCSALAPAARRVLRWPPILAARGPDQGRDPGERVRRRDPSGEPELRRPSQGRPPVGRDHACRTGRGSWADRKTTSLEERLGEVCKALDDLAAADDVRRAEEDRKKEERRRHWAAAMERAKALATTDYRSKVLSDRVGRWRQAIDIEAYCAALEEHVAGTEAAAGASQWIQ